MSVEIELDGKKVTLHCTTKAAQTISMLGGIKGAIERLAVFDLDTYAIVIAAGADLKVTPFGDGLSDLREKVYRTGLTALSGHLAKYCATLANGGKEVEE